jgi:flagellar protein FlaG
MDIVKLSPPNQATQTTGREARIERSSAITDKSADTKRALATAIAGSLDKAIVGPQRMEVRMRVEADLNRVIARVVDSETGEVIREVPPDELVDLAKRVQALIGAMFDKRA